MNEIYRHPFDNWACPVCHSSVMRVIEDCPGFTQAERDDCRSKHVRIKIAGEEIMVPFLYIEKNGITRIARDRWGFKCNGKDCRFEYDAI